MVRLKDIAARAGVSMMTVSKVLRDAPDISAGTKSRVRRLAAEMGYVPDTLAQSLRTRTTKLLGLVVSSASNPMAARNIAVAQERAVELGYDLLLAQTSSDEAREETALRRMLARRVDGLIVAPVHRFARSAGVYAELKAARLPVVILGAHAGFTAGFANVEPDDRQGALQAVRHLIGLGHRAIGFLAGPPYAPWAQARLAGYQQALRESGVEVRDNLVFFAGQTIEDGQTAALQMLNEKARPTAIFAVNDFVAVGAARILLRQRVRIPGDVSLIGFGDGLLAENFAVPLTTVAQPQHRLASVAVDLLHEQIRGGVAVSQTLATELVTRESSGPPPSA